MQGEMNGEQGRFIQNGARTTKGEQKYMRTQVNEKESKKHSESELIACTEGREWLAWMKKHAEQMWWRWNARETTEIIWGEMNAELVALFWKTRGTIWIQQKCEGNYMDLGDMQWEALELNRNTCRCNGIHLKCVRNNSDWTEIQGELAGCNRNAKGTIWTQWKCILN